LRVLLAIKNQKPYKLATSDKIGKTDRKKTAKTTAEGTQDAEDVVVVEREVSTQHVTAVMSFSARTNSAKSGLTYDFKSTSQVNKTSNRRPQEASKNFAKYINLILGQVYGPDCESENNFLYK
jgi:hypothetical protein